MPDRADTAPALSDRELRETLDLLGEVVASMSTKLDAQEQIRSEEMGLVFQGFTATFTDLEAIKAQTDPAGYARQIGAQLENTLDPVLDRLAALQDGFAADRKETQRRLDELVHHEEQTLLRLRYDLEKAQRLKRRLPLMALLGFSLVLALGVALPRVMTGNPAGCVIIGGHWSVDAEGVETCAFLAG